MRVIFIPARGARSLRLVVALALCAAGAGQAAAQNRWDDKVEIKRPETKPGRKPAPRQSVRRAPSVERAAPLQLQFRLLKFTDDGRRSPVNVNGIFSPRDRLLLAVKANQSGYLYVIRRTSPGGDGQILFPARNHNDGSSYVRKDSWFVLPSDCSDFSTPCWFNLPPTAGSETLTLILSRDQIDELPNRATGSVQLINAQRLAALATSSEQKLERRAGLITDGVWVENVNTANNEELIETLTINNAGAGKAGERASGN